MTTRRVRKSIVVGMSFALWVGAGFGKNKQSGDEFFRSSIAPHLQIEISPTGMKVLREYRQIWRQPRPERVDVQATIREGEQVYTNVAVHLKGSYTFEPVDAKPSLTLHFDKFAPGQRFHGLTKIHLNNSIQDPSYLGEQLARELFAEAGVVSPRAGHALVSLNGRELGLFVLIEGANKQFIKRHFKSTKGNLYDGGSGGDVTKALQADSGDQPEDRTDLTNLVNAAREPDPAKRLRKLEEVLDIEHFISFSAIENLIVHWDGYTIGCNNYRLFHDVARDKMVFIPQGLDQLFGVSSSPELSVTPPLKGLVAQALLSVPEARARYLKRLDDLSAKEFRLEALHSRVDRLAAQLRPSLAKVPHLRSEFDQAVNDLKGRIAERTASVAQQLSHPQQPLKLAKGETLALSVWTFKGGPTQPASGSRRLMDGRQILQVTGRSSASSGAWRARLLLEEGRYEFSGMGQTEKAMASNAQATNGIILRRSGERSIEGITITDEWKPLSYEFVVHGIENVELVCEFRGRGVGYFDASSLRLTRKDLLSDKP